MVLLLAAAFGGDVVLNEYNAVAPDMWLGNPVDLACVGPLGEGCASKKDTFFGRVLGNGGNWFELVITTDHLDMRGWTLQWQETGNGKAGRIELTQATVWSDVRAGTVLTFTELTTAQGGLDTDVSMSPCMGDWWMNINTFDGTLVTTTTNVVGDGPGNFSVGNDEWQLRVLDATGRTRSGWAGEGARTYTGTGVNDRENFRLERDPSRAISGSSRYDDATRSSFGSANSWPNAAGCRIYQDLSTIRRVLRGNECQSCAPVVLNEANAVGDLEFINGGTAILDEDGGLAEDSFFGRTQGNGGDWFELVVTADSDMRGWRLEWDSEPHSGVIVLSQDTRWSAVPAGTYLTFTELTTAQGGLDSQFGPGWWNVNTFDTAYVSVTGTTELGQSSGTFDVNDDDWTLRVVDAAGQELVPPTGEGSPMYFQDGVSDTNVLRLEADPSSGTSRTSPYDDGSTSTFGGPNRWTDCAAGSVSQDVGLLPDCRGPVDLTLGGTCPGTVDLALSELTPRGDVVLFTSAQTGSSTFYVGPCPGIELPLTAPNLVASLRANASGSVDLSPMLPAQSCGLEVVAVDVSTCAVSNTATLP